MVKNSTDAKKHTVLFRNTSDTHMYLLWSFNSFSYIFSAIVHLSHTGSKLHYKAQVEYNKAHLFNYNIGLWEIRLVFEFKCYPIIEFLSLQLCKSDKCTNRSKWFSTFVSDKTHFSSNVELLERQTVREIIGRYNLGTCFNMDK